MCSSGGVVQLEDSVLNIYPSTAASRQTYHRAGGWAGVNSEQTAWAIMQTCLDIYVQRVSVIGDASNKQSLRGWYEGLLEIGQKLYGSN
jgi:hypothetical protein